jgi:hypothetical protein
MNPIQNDPNLTDVLRGFHADEDGMEAVQVVMVVAIGAVILLAFARFVWPLIKDYTKNAINEISGYKPES